MLAFMAEPELCAFLGQLLLHWRKTHLPLGREAGASRAGALQPALQSLACSPVPFPQDSLPPSIHPSLPVGLRQAEAHGQPLEQEPVLTSSFQPQDVSL